MSSKEYSPRLGRGLAALLGDSATPAPAPQSPGVRSLAVEMLEPSPFQPRGAMDPEALGELTASIRERGILQPLLVRPHPAQSGRYQIIAGERRWRASQAAGLHEVPALIRELSDVDAMAAGLVENLQRQDLNPIEEAEGFRRLLDEFGVSQEAVGQAVGKSRVHVSNTLRLLGLPEVVRAELRKGTLTAGHARALLMHPAPETVMLAVLSRGLNVRQTEALAKTAASPSAGAVRSAKPKDPETVTLERELAERLGLKVEIAYDGKGGSVRIFYRDLDQLDSVLAYLTPSRSG
jgi:ParB family transcriptional regulator, chromosome partitioning protein